MVLGILLLFNLLFRFIYLIYNFRATAGIPYGEIIDSFFWGMRFDLSAICILNGILFLLHSVPLQALSTGRAFRISAWAFSVINFPVLLVNGIDVVYYQFSSKRITHELFTSSNDLGNFSLSDFLPYTWIIIVLLASAWLQFRLLRRAGAHAQLHLERHMPPAPRQWIALPLVVLLLFLGIRGGLQHMPLRPASAFTTSNPFTGNLTLNSAFSILSSIEFRAEQPVKFMETGEAIAQARKVVRNDFDGKFLSDEYPLLRQASFEGPEQKYNVVFLIVESFNAGYLGKISHAAEGKSLTPNLDTLASRGRLFTNFYANGTRSVESLSSILNSEPELFSRPFIGSAYETNLHWGIGNILSTRGYHTSFFCGGKNGTVGFDGFSALSGFNHYFGQNEYPADKASVNSKWGLHDGPMLNWMADEQAHFPEPFASVWFSISNHFPFDEPAACPPHILQRELRPVETTVMYTDYVIGEYFKKVSRMPWYPRTIFIITGDHCLFTADDPPREMMQNFQVPLLMVGPGVPVGEEARLSSQLSLLPTLIELLRLDTPHASSGVSLFSQRNSPLFLANMVGISIASRNDVAVYTNFADNVTVSNRIEEKWNLNHDTRRSAEAEELLLSLRSMYQVCHAVRLSNTLIHPQWMGR